MANKAFLNKKKSITSFDEVMEVVGTYITNKEDIDFITSAFEYANEKHAGQFRKSGEPYINHCLSVTYLLACYQSAPDTLAAGLLHDTLEDCGVSYNDLKTTFNDDVASIVQAVTKIKNLPDVSLEETSASTHRKLILAMAKDIRAVIVKLCDRLHNMRTLDFMKPEKQIAISKETMAVYAPLAHRLGMSELKNELENLCFLHLNPEAYHETEELIAKKIKESYGDLNLVMDRISNVLKESNIPFRIFGRNKHLYSVYKKITERGIPFEKIYDLQAIRIITRTKLQCYEILGVIHDIYKPMPNRFKDYIAMPKSNMYQSLHTTVIDENGALFEIQIRTEDMDYIAERGIAAHWIYKETHGENISKSQEMSEQQLSWLRDLIKINDETEDTTDLEYMKQIQKDIFESSIYVLTPKGKIVDLPSGSTPIDFAYRVHTQVGNSCIGAMVNKIIVPLDTELQNGDIVEIRTSKQSPGPSEGWLTFVKTSLAKTQIKKFFLKKEGTNNEEVNRFHLIERGINYLNAAIEEKLISKDDCMKALEVQSNLAMFNVSSKDELLMMLGKKEMTANSVINKLFDQTSLEKQLEEINKKNYTVKKTKNKGNILIGGKDPDMKIEMAVCCKPLPGDPIVGYISRNSGIKIHRADCKNIKDEKKRLIMATWNEELEEQYYPVDMEIDSYDRNNLLVDLMGVISSLNIRVDSISAKSHYQTKTATLSCTVYIKDKDQLGLLSSRIMQINGIIEVKRVTR